MLHNFCPSSLKWLEAFSFLLCLRNDSAMPNTISYIPVRGNYKWLINTGHLDNFGGIIIQLTGKTEINCADKGSYYWFVFELYNELFLIIGTHRV